MIGFGLSEKPTREWAHTLDGHIANLVSLVRQLGLTRVTVVCHDWGGPDWFVVCHEQSGPGSSARRHEHLGMATAARRVPHTLFPWRMMHAPLVGPYLLGRHNVLARRGVYLVGRRSRQVPSRGACGLRRRAAGR